VKVVEVRSDWMQVEVFDYRTDTGAQDGYVGATCAALRFDRRTPLLASPIPTGSI